MNEFKSRIIRVSNIPHDEVIYRVKSKPVISFLLMLILGCILLFTKYWMFGIFFIIVSLYALFAIPNHTILDITDRFLISYNAQNKQECIIVYWSEIEQWTYILTRQITDFLYLELNDGDRMNIPIMNPKKSIVLLSKYTGNKGVQTGETRRFFK